MLLLNFYFKRYRLKLKFNDIKKKKPESKSLHFYFEIMETSYLANLSSYVRENSACALHLR